MCTQRTLIAKKYSMKMITKSKFTTAHQIKDLQLEKQKSWETGAKSALCSAKCALCTNSSARPNCQKIQYKNVYEIQFTPAH